MKHRCLVGLWGLVMMAGVQADHLKVSFEDVILLNQRGVSEQTLLLFLENRALTFKLDAVTLDKLMTVGVSEEVIRYLVSQTQPEHAPSDTKAKEKAPESTPITNYVPYPVYPTYFYTPNYYSYSYVYGRSYYPHDWFGPHFRFGYSGRRHAGDYLVHRPRVQHNSNADHHVVSEPHRADHRVHSEEHVRHAEQNLHNDHHNRSAGRHSDLRSHRAGHRAHSKHHKKNHVEHRADHKSNADHNVDSASHRAEHRAHSRHHKKHHGRSHGKSEHSGDRGH